MKAANSPRPGTWVLERSLDGELYEPWQYFARNDKECFEKFRVSAKKGKPHYSTDIEVICTSFYSRLTPLENGEVGQFLYQKHKFCISFLFIGIIFIIQYDVMF